MGTAGYTAEVKQGQAGSALLFQLSHSKKGSSHFRVLLVISWFKTAPQQSAEVMCRVPKGKKAVMFLVEKMCVTSFLQARDVYPNLSSAADGGHLGGSWVEHVTQSRGHEFSPYVGRKAYFKKTSCQTF